MAKGGKTKGAKSHGHSHDNDDHHGHSHSHHEENNSNPTSHHGHSHGLTTATTTTTTTTTTSKPSQQHYNTYQSMAEDNNSNIQQHALQVAPLNYNSPDNDHIVCSHAHVTECAHDECQSEDDRKRHHSGKILRIVTMLCFTFMCVELVGGYLSGSLAIMTDAAHLLSDLVSFLISLLSITLATKRPTNAMTFGYHRVEILGAIISVFMIWALTVVLVYESIHRILNPDLIEVNGGMMLTVAVIGFIVNVVMGLVLILSGEGHNHSHGGLPHGHSHDHGHEHGHHEEEEEHGHSDDDESDGDDDHHHNHSHGSEHSPLLKHNDHGHSHDHGHAHAHGGDKKKTKSLVSHHPHDEEVENVGLINKLMLLIFPADVTKRSINVQAAVLHVLGDLMQSVGVIIAALVIIINPNWKLADPFCTLLFSVIVLTTTTRVIKQGFTVLMEGTPEGVDSVAVAESLKKIRNVVTVHDLHVWSVSMESRFLAVHVVVAPPTADGQESAENIGAAVIAKANKMLKKKFGITHTTIQIEEQHHPGVCVPKTLTCKRQDSSTPLPL